MTLPARPACEARRWRRSATNSGSDRKPAVVGVGLAVDSAAGAAAVVAGVRAPDTCASPNQQRPRGAGMRKVSKSTRTETRRQAASSSCIAARVAASSVALAALCSAPRCFGQPAASTATGAYPGGFVGFGSLSFAAGAGAVGPVRHFFRVGDDEGFQGGREVRTSDAERRRRLHRQAEAQDRGQQQAGQQRRLKQRHGCAVRSHGLWEGGARRSVEAVTATRAGGALGVRGGGRRSWFTGYEDTTQEGSSSEEGETTDYESGLTDEVTTDDVGRGGGGGDDASADEGGSGNGEKAEAIEEKQNDKQGGGDTTEGEEKDGGGRDEGDSKLASPDPRRQAFDNVYARTIARRRATAAVFRVLQRSLIKAAFLLVAFQIFPWLRNNFIVQCLLVGSLLLQTVTELVGIARAADAAGKSGKGRGQGRPGDHPVEGSGADTPPSSSSSPGVIGGLMKVFSLEDEHRQHLDFQRLNDMFDKDVEALAAASQPKTDVPSMLLPTGPRGSSGFPVAGLMMKVFKGLAGKHESKKASRKASDRDGGRSRSSSPTRSATRGKSDTGGHKVGRRHRRDRRKKGVAQPTREDAAVQKQKTKIPSAEETKEKNEGGESPVENSQTERFALQNVRFFDADGRGTATGNETEGASAEGCTDQGVSVEGRGAHDPAADAGRSGGYVDSAGGGDGSAGERAPKNGTAVAASKPEKRVFVLKFRPGLGPEEGQEQQMDLLSATVSFLVANGNNATDEVVVLLESGGGEVSTFGLAAARLARLKESGFNLTVCVDKIAASGGYMMACIADKLVVAPFAMLGSIGVVGGMPNFNKALKKFGVDYFHFTAGQQKSLVGPFQEVTKANQAMQQRQMDTIHSAFKHHVQRHRPTVDVEAVGTGEVWLGQQAVELHLADEVGTAMEYLQGKMSDCQVFLIKQHKKKISGGPNLLRALLLGPLAKASGSGFSTSIIFEVARMLLFPLQGQRYSHGATAGRNFYEGGRSGQQARPFEQEARPFPHLSHGAEGNFDEDSLTRALTKAMHAAHAASTGGSAGAAGGGGGLDGVDQEMGGGGGLTPLAGGRSSKFATTMPGSCWEDVF